MTETPKQASTTGQPAAPVKGAKVTGLLTFIAAGIATGVAAVGMWRFFGDVLHIDGIFLRGALFAFLEIALLVSALRARRNLLTDIARLQQEGADARRASTGLDGAAVWVLAILSGAFSAMDARSSAEATFRLIAPLVAAWLWERGLAAHRRRARNVRRVRGIDWAGLLERALIRLRLLTVAERTATEVDRARRLARLAQLRCRVHDLTVAGAFGWRVRRATKRYRRSLAAANEHLGLATDPALRLELQMNLAVLYRAVEGTAPKAVAGLAPWGATPPEQAVAPPAEATVAPAQNATAAPSVPATEHRNGAARSVRRTVARPPTKSVAGATGRTDDELMAIVAPLVTEFVAVTGEPPSQRALHKAIKEQTGVGIGFPRIVALVERAQRERNDGPAVAPQRGDADDEDREPAPINGHRPTELIGASA